MDLEYGFEPLCNGTDLGDVWGGSNSLIGRQRQMDTYRTLPVPERISLLRDELFAQQTHFCFERARIVTESYRETEGEPSALRRAKALHAVNSSELGQLFVQYALARFSPGARETIQLLSAKMEKHGSGSLAKPGASTVELFNINTNKVVLTKGEGTYGLQPNVGPD